MRILFLIRFLVANVHLITDTGRIQYNVDLAITEVIRDTSKIKKKFSQDMRLTSLKCQRCF